MASPTGQLLQSECFPFKMAAALSGFLFVGGNDCNE
jgi:hypothetical protein